MVDVPSVGVEPTYRVFQTRALTTLANLAWFISLRISKITFAAGGTNNWMIISNVYHHYHSDF